MKGNYFIVCVLLIVALTSVAIAHSEIQPEDHDTQGKLNMITITQEKIEGEYHDLAGGIHFISEVRGEYHFLSITTADGEPLVIAKQPHNSTMLMTVTDTDFLVMKNPSDSGLSKYTDYIVPTFFHKHVERALKRHRFSSKLLRQLDSREVNETRHAAIENLVLRPEMELIIAAAEALGNSGVIGAEVPAAMPFYVLELRLAKYRDILLNPGIEADNIDYEEILLQEHRQKRSCHQCTTGRCPYRGYGSNCRGMCGPRCWCHSWLCGDCCVHRGCLDHDYCCGRYGYTSWTCITFWNINCSSRYDC